MAELAACKNNPSQKSAQSGREPQERHHIGVANNNEQGKRRKHLAQSRGVNISKDRLGQKDPRSDHNRNGCQRRQRHAPSGQAFKQRRMMRTVLCLQHDRAIWPKGDRRSNAQERYQRQKRDHGNILRQQDRKDRAPAGCLHKAFFCKGLKHNCG